MKQLLLKYVKATVPVFLLTVMVVTGCRTLFSRTDTLHRDISILP